MKKIILIALVLMSPLFSASIKIRAKSHNGITKVMFKIEHPMLSESSAKKLNVKADYISYVVVKIDDDIVYELSNSGMLSKNPMFKFKCYANSDEVLTIEWVDTLGHKNIAYRKIR